MNTNWTSDPPPPSFPILCAQVTQCGNSLASVWFNVVWGARIPTLEEPLVKGTAWTTTGGYQNDVASDSQYLGEQTVKVPAFAQRVRAAHVRSDISQAGAIGDPYGSGVRDVWWVYGVGPVKVVFHHGGGGKAPVTQAVLSSTSLHALAPPPDDNYFPLVAGVSGKFEWTNAKHLKKPEIQSFKVDQSANGSARLSVSSVSGPIHTKGAYFYTLRNDGLTNLAGTAKAASLVKLPPLGPASAPVSKRRQFFTVFDLMNFGFNPVLPAYAKAGDTWSAAATGTDHDAYGVVGTSTVLGVQKVKLPGGTFMALAVRTHMRQPGFRFGSGTRTCWFAPGKGLVKLVFKHGDGSTSQVVLIKT
jgi:hypothetical protein